MRWDTRALRERLRRRLKRLQVIKTWQLMVLLLLSTLLTATFFRLNSLTMAELRRDVVTADEQGDSTAIHTTISALGAYVTTHMNTSLGDGFYLTASYERARAAAVQAAADTANPDSSAYQQASVECQNASTRAPYGGYVACVQARVKQLGSSSTLVSELQLPRYELYKVSFVSPVWSADWAGFATMISVFILLMIITRITGVIVLKLLLKQRFRNI